jgi:subtilisin family serine protease
VVVVGLRAGVPEARLRALERRLGVRWARVLGGRLGLVKAVRRLDDSRGIGLTVVLGLKQGSVLRAVRSLRSYWRWVRFAEPDYLMRASAANVPNDPSFGLQWGDLNTGQTVNGVSGTAGADDKAAQAWGVSTGSRTTVIGEVDTGVDLAHPDLQGNIWTNPGGIGGCAAGTHGYTVLANSCSPIDDDNAYGGHGSHVAGIMGAVGNNGTGVAGMNWQTTILPVKWLDANAWGSDTSLVTALDWLINAKQAGVNIQVINDSATFEGDTGSQALSDAIDQLGADGILFVTAAGNTGENDDNTATARYPCDYDRANEICVTATDQNDQLPSWANYGPQHVDLGAPGNNIYSTLKSNNYGYINGGSMAAAQVSGAAALILSVQQMSTTSLKADILNNVDPLSSLNGKVRTGGRLDVCKAVPGCAGPPPPPPPVPVNSGLPVISGTAQVGQTLSVSTGSWSNSPSSYSYGWQRCDSGGGNCSAIQNQSRSSYVVQSGDVGFTLRAVVTASNAGGSSQPAASDPSAVVTSGPATVNFGLTSVGGFSDSFAANRKRVNAYSISSGGSLTSLTVYLEPTGRSGTADVEGIVYADSAGKPGALLGVTTQLVFSGSESAGWYQMDFSSPISLTAGRYWIGVITGGSSSVAGLQYNNVTGSRDYNSNTYTSGPTNPFGSFKNDSEQMSLYGTYTPG